MRKERRNIKKWLYWFSLALVLIIIYKVLDSFSALTMWFGRLFKVLAPFVVGLIIAYVLYVPAKKLERLLSKNKLLKKRAKGISVLVVYLLLILFLTIAIKFLIPPLVESCKDLANNIQSYYIDLRARIDSLPEDSFLRSQGFRDTFSSLNNIKFEDLISIDKITIYAQGLLSVASGIFDVFVALIVSVYLLLERRSIIGFFKRFTEASFSTEVYQSVRRYFHKSSEIFCNFLAGQIFDAFVVGILTSIAMSIMGVKYAVILGMFIGLFNLIPYFGAIIAVLISVFITLITGGVAQAVEMAIVVIVLQFGHFNCWLFLLYISFRHERQNVLLQQVTFFGSLFSFFKWLISSKIDIKEIELTLISTKLEQSLNIPSIKKLSLGEKTNKLIFVKLIQPKSIPYILAIFLVLKEDKSIFFNFLQL